MVSVSVCQVGRPGLIRLFKKGGILSACYQPVPASTDDWFTKGHSMCYHFYVLMHVKDPWLSVVRVGHRVPLAGFSLSLYSLHMLDRDVNIIQNPNACVIKEMGW